MRQRINASQFAGSWYPADPARLAALFERPVSPAEHAGGVDDAAGWGGAVGPGDTADAGATGDAGHGRPRLAILPHAGLAYSARGQSAFWRRWAGEDVSSTYGIDAIVVVAPSHYVPLKADTTVGAVFNGHETTGAILPGVPLCLGDREDASVLQREHAVELLLPAVAWYEISVPVGAIVVGPFSGTAGVRAAAHRVTERLGRTFDPNRVLWLVSSDFTHYGPRFGFLPLGRGRYAALGPSVAKRDYAVAEAAASATLEAFWEAIREESTVCGRYAVALALAILEQSQIRTEGRVLSYYTSADFAPVPEREEDFVCYATVEVAEV